MQQEQVCLCYADVMREAMLAHMPHAVADGKRTQLHSHFGHERSVNESNRCAQFRVGDDKAVSSIARAA